MTQSVSHLENWPRFLERVVRLNAVHAPDDRLHAPLRLDPQQWQHVKDQSEPGDGSLLDRAAGSRRALRAIHSHFPAGAPAHEQAAYLVRAFAALRPFDEANHRTGWDFTAELLDHHGCELMATEAEGRELGNQVWDGLDEDRADGVAQAAARDELFEYLAQWFRTRIAAGSGQKHD